jgi:hypothetical protein
MRDSDEEHATKLIETRNLFIILIGKPQKKSPVVRSRAVSVYDINQDLRKISLGNLSLRLKSTMMKQQVT